jgi:hypothetical protein
MWQNLFMSEVRHSRHSESEFRPSPQTTATVFSSPLTPPLAVSCPGPVEPDLVAVVLKVMVLFVVGDARVPLS